MLAHLSTSFVCLDRALSRLRHQLVRLSGYGWPPAGGHMRTTPGPRALRALAYIMVDWDQYM
jgi:hypothetical protein